LSRSITLHFASTLAASPERVWRSVHTMNGVNAELSPWMRMTFPRGQGETPLEDAPLHTLLFQSWILLLGIPVDRHALQLVEVEAVSGFVESSTSWTERHWVHARSLHPVGNMACRLEDRLVLTPRLPSLTPILVAIVTRVFRHRHRRLRMLFGEAETEPVSPR
jgi:hypothetical protein